MRGAVADAGRLSPLPPICGRPWRLYYVAMRYLLIAAPALMASTIPPVASLRVGGERSTFSVLVEEGAGTGYHIRIKCVSECARPIEFSEPVGDVPMGLFTRDKDNLVFSLWSGGSVYRVRVYQVNDTGVRNVAELSSRGLPDVSTDNAGRPAIRTYEADSGAQALRPVLRSFIRGHFEVVR